MSRRDSSLALRDYSRTEVLLKRRKELKSLDELLDATLPTLAARLWQTCCWPDHKNGWKIGDFNYLIASIEPEPETNLYVQFWSEPQEPVLVEICSGNWNPGAVKYVQARQRRAIESLGYESGGEARNYQKEVTITSPRQAEAAARQALKVLYEIFQYRGRCPLVVDTHRGERADRLPVYTSLTPEDFLKLAGGMGYRPPREAAPPPTDSRSRLVASGEEESASRLPDLREADAPVALMMRGRRRTAVQFAGRVPRNRLFSTMLLRTVIHTPRALSDEEVATMADKLPCMWLLRAPDGDLYAGMDLMLAGGVTAEWLMTMLASWDQSCRRCERLMRRMAMEPPTSGARQVSPSVH